jgi:hypothetical protein
MPWSAQDAEILYFYRRLVAARNDEPGLWRSERRTVASDDVTGLLAYGYGSPETEAIVVLHNGDGVVRFRPLGSDGWRLSFFTDDSVTFEDGVLTVPARAGAILGRHPTR